MVKNMTRKIMGQTEWNVYSWPHWRAHFIRCYFNLYSKDRTQSQQFTADTQIKYLKN